MVTRLLRNANLQWNAQLFRLGHSGNFFSLSVVMLTSANNSKIKWKICRTFSQSSYSSDTTRCAQEIIVNSRAQFSHLMKRNLFDLCDILINKKQIFMYIYSLTFSVRCLQQFLTDKLSSSIVYFEVNALPEALFCENFSNSIVFCLILNTKHF